MNKKHAVSFLIGFALATVAFFTMGQSEGIYDRYIGNYQGVEGDGGVYIVNTKSGTVRFVAQPK